MSNPLKKKAELLKKIQYQLLRDTAFKRKIALMTADQIRKRTRLGKGVDESGKQTRLKVLSDKYIDVRKKYRKNLTNLTTPNKSNLSATGQMLDAITGEPTPKGFRIFFINARKRDLQGNISKVTNNQLSEFVESNGRRFFDISIPEENMIRRELRAELTRRIKILTQ